MIEEADVVKWNNALPYSFIPLGKSAARAPAGHAIVWNPKLIQMELIVSHAAMARDNWTKTLAPYHKTVEPWKDLEPHPGLSVRQAVEEYPGGIAYFNVGESGLQINPLIENGKLLTKPRGARALCQSEWTPLNDRFSFFLQHSDGQVDIRELRIEQDRIHLDDLKYVSPGTNGFSVPYILRSGHPVELRRTQLGQAASSGETMFQIGALAAMCAIGLTGDGQVVWVGLTGGPEEPPTENELVCHLLDLGAREGLFAGASGDVQYYDAESKTLCVAAERAKPADKKWVLRAGQTERGLTCIGKLGSRQASHRLAST